MVINSEKMVLTIENKSSSASVNLTGVNSIVGLQCFHVQGFLVP